MPKLLSGKLVPLCQAPFGKVKKPAALGDGLDFGGEDFPEKIQELGFGENIGRCIIEKGWSLKIAEVESLIGIHLANIVG